MNRPADLWVGPGVLDELVQRSGSDPEKQHHTLARALHDAKALDFRLPRGWALCSCEPLLVDLPTTEELSVDAALIGKHAGLPPTATGEVRPGPGELIGAVMMSSRRTRLMVRGKLMPDYTYLNTWKTASVSFTSRDTLLLSAVKTGAVLVWPAVLIEPLRIRTDGELPSLQSD